MKRKMLFVLVIIFFSSSLFAFSFSTTLDAKVERNYISSAFSNALSDIDDYKTVKFLNLIGPEAGFSCYPLGINFPALKAVGAIKFVTGKDNSFYLSRNNDHKGNISIGLEEDIFLFDRTYIFLSVGVNYSWYRIAENNLPNNRIPVDYVYFSEYGINGELGVMTRHNDQFFKFGFFCEYNLSNKREAYSLGLFVGLGIIH